MDKSLTDPSTDRVRRIMSLWNWLPAFRVVAETEHLPTASRRLNISASALSRTIRMIERDLGEPLFRRAGRNLELNDAGSKLLVAVRDAMRLVHQGVRDLDSNRLAGPVHISSHGLLTLEFLLPALEQLARDQPQLIPHVSQLPTQSIHDALLRGRLDVAFSEDPGHHDHLDTACVGSLSRSIYCGPGHPLYHRVDVTNEELLEYGFVAPVPDASGRTVDGWPVDLPRRVILHVTDELAVRQVCSRGQHLAVLLTLDSHVQQFGLRELPSHHIPECRIFATRRHTLGPPGRTEAIIEVTRRQLAARASQAEAARQQQQAQQHHGDQQPRAPMPVDAQVHASYGLPVGHHPNAQSDAQHDHTSQGHHRNTPSSIHSAGINGSINSVPPGVSGP